MGSRVIDLTQHIKDHMNFEIRLKNKIKNELEGFGQPTADYASDSTNIYLCQLTASCRHTWKAAK